MNDKAYVLIDLLILILIISLLGILTSKSLRINIKLARKCDIKEDVTNWDMNFIEHLYLGKDLEREIIYEGIDINEILKEFDQEDRVNRELFIGDIEIKLDKVNKGKYLWELDYEIKSVIDENIKIENKIYIHNGK